MNPSVDHSTVGETPTSQPAWQPPSLWLTLTAILALPLFQYGVAALTGSIGIGILALLVVYPLTLYLYRAVATRAYVGRLGLLLTASLAAVALGAAFVPAKQALGAAISIAVVPLVAVLVGYQARTALSRGRLYLFGLGATLVGSLIVFAPMWPKLAQVWNMAGENMASVVEQNLTTMGYHADTVAEYRLSFLEIMNGFRRLIPVATLLSPLALFSVGYLWFLQSGLPPSATIGKPEPFDRWKIPFAFAPVLIVVIAGRLLGGEFIQQAADNLLLVLAIVYMIGGLCLIQSLFARFKLPIFVRVMFYIALTLSGLLGFLMTVLLGFIDSFADWRKIGSGSIELEKKS